MLLGEPTEEDLDLEIQIGLLGGEEERREAITKLFNRYKERLMSFLEKKRPYLLPDAAATAINDAVIEIYRMAEERPQDLEAPLRPLLFTITDRRAVDQFRKQSRAVRSDDELTEQIGNALSRTKTGEAWQAFFTTSETRLLLAEVQEEFRAFVSTLPPKQRLVAGVLADDFLLSDLEIASELRKRWNTVATVLEVKGAKQALMKKFREILKKKGTR
jgi:DNA-directed RNA polymerase specialized sigma24 family protein